MKIEDSFSKLVGRPVTDAERIQLYKLKEVGKYDDNDAIWLFYVAQEAFKTQLKDILRGVPDEFAKMVVTAKSDFNEIAIAADKHAKSVITTAAAETLMPAAEKAFTDGVKKYTSVIEIAARKKSSGWVAMVGGGVLIVGILLGGGFGYYGQMLSDRSTLEKAIEDASVATKAQAKAETDATAAIAAATKAANAKADGEGKQLRASSGWLGTADGQLAYKFFTKGTGKSAATCDADLHWEKFKMDDGRYLCVPMRQGKFYGWTSGDTGWVIP